MDQFDSERFSNPRQIGVNTIDSGLWDFANRTCARPVGRSEVARGLDGRVRARNHGHRARRASSRETELFLLYGPVITVEHRIQGRGRPCRNDAWGEGLRTPRWRQSSCGYRFCAVSYSPFP